MSTFHKKHHYLVTAEIVFRGVEDEINAIRINAVLAQEDKALPVKSIGRAQQAAQINFHNRMQDPDIEIVDVVIMNLAYLGHMSEKEFQKTPDGHKLVERLPGSGLPN